MLRARFSAIPDLGRGLRSGVLRERSVGSGRGEPRTREVASYGGSSTVVFVCLDDDPAGLRATIRLRDVLPERIGVVLCTTGHSDIARLLRLAGRDEPLNVNGFGLLDQVCRPEVLLNGDRERLAQAMHGEYVRAQTVLGHPVDDVSMQPWQQLPESLRESNRDQAADVGRKLKEVGLDLVLTSSWGPPEFSFTTEEMDVLSREEHDRWMRKLLADGWTRGLEKNVESRSSATRAVGRALGCREGQGRQRSTDTSCVARQVRIRDRLTQRFEWAILLAQKVED